MSRYDAASGSEMKMAVPLRKLKDNKPYERPSSIEVLLDSALMQTQDVILKRAYIRVKTDSSYLPTECLVYLLRHAFRSGNTKLRDVIVNPLLKRCERILNSKIPDDQPNAEELREAVLGKFTELLARDANDHSQTKLDYYEVRFNDAFRKLRISFFRSEKYTRVSMPLAADADEGQAEIDPEGVCRLLKSTGQELSPEDVVTGKQLCDAVEALPHDETRAIILHFFYGYKIESIDPNERTVASICEVSGRMIRTRLKSAIGRLKEKF